MVHNSFKIESSIRCSSPGFVANWKHIPTEKEQDTLHLITNGKRYNLNLYVRNLSSEILYKFLTLVIINIEDGIPLSKSVNIAFKEFKDNDEVKNLLFKLKGVKWEPVAKMLGMKYHRCDPLVYSKFVNEYRDVYGIAQYETYIDISLHYRASDLNNKRYLPLSFDPVMMYYARGKSNANDPYEYANIALKLRDTKIPLILHSSFNGDIEGIRDSIVYALKETIKILQHPTIQALRENKLTSGIVRLATDSPDEFKFILEALKIEDYKTVLGEYLDIPVKLEDIKFLLNDFSEDLVDQVNQMYSKYKSYKGVYTKNVEYLDLFTENNPEWNLDTSLKIV